MGTPMTELAAQAIELDAWVEEIPDYQAHFDRFLTRLEKSAHKINISNQTTGGGTQRSPMRVPFRAQGGAAIQQATADSNAGIFVWQRGTGSTYDGFVVSPVRLLNVCEISNLTIQATDGKERGLVKIQRKELQNSLKVFDNGCEGLFHRDGSGTIDSIPTSGATINSGTGGGSSGTATYSSIIGLPNAASFQDQQTIQVFSGIGGTNRGSFVISYVDPVALTLYSTTVLPSGTAAGDLLIVQGATGLAGSSILGKDYWLQNGNVGTIGGIPKANYPGRLSTPVINFNSTSTLDYSSGARVEAIRMRAMGDDYDQNEEAFWIANPVQGVTLSNLFYNQGFTRTDEGSMERAPDMIRKSLQDEVMGRDVVWASTAEPARMDLIVPDTCYLGELFPTRLHEWTPGITVAAVPAIGQSAGATYFDSQMFAYERGCQLVINDPKRNFSLLNLPVIPL
ncbi:MAG: hypothetical protein WAN28_05915 [Terracidiphilus sp.]